MYDICTRIFFASYFTVVRNDGMGLRFIYGRAGSGKTRLCLEEIKTENLRGAQHPLIFLVPEQFTFQSERDLINALGKGGIIGNYVLSFRRLAHMVFNEVGGIASIHLHPAGKCMIIYSILDKFSKDLKLFSKSADRQGYVNKLSTLFTEFKQYNITPEILSELGERVEEGRGLKVKLGELAQIYTEYESILEDRYLDSDDDLTLAAGKLQQSDMFTGAEIWIDGFSGFTPQEYNLIQVLMQRASRVNVSLCTDVLQAVGGEATGIDVFSKVKSAYRKLSSMAEALGIKTEKPVSLNNDPSYRLKDSLELAHLEKYFNAYPYSVYMGRTKDVTLFYSLNLFSEIEACASEIVRLMRDEGLRSRDIAVVVQNIKSYERLIEVIFKDYDIPHFIDRKKEITDHPLVRLILSTLDIFKENWSYESVFRYLKTGFTGLESEEIDKLENYVLACGIRGGSWTNGKDWSMSSDFMPNGKAGEAEAEVLREINRIKNEVTGPLIDFRNKTKRKKSALEICTALYDFLCRLKVPEKLQSYIDDLRNAGQLSLADEYDKVWSIITEVLDQAVEVTGEADFNIERFSNILKIGFSEYKIGLIPASLDQVLVGSIERSKSHEIKALFILGANDGVLPSVSKEEGILTDADRAGLSNLGIELAGDTRAKAFDEQFLIYKTLTASGKYLRISWPIADNEGKSQRHSVIVSRLRKLFPEITEGSNLLEPDTQKEETELVTGRMPAFRNMVRTLRKAADGKEPKELWKMVYCWFGKNEEWKQKNRAIRASFEYKNTARPIGGRRAEKLYGNPAYSSVSRLESYASCPFSYYVQYGLRARERKVYSFSPLDVGTFMHKVIECFSLMLEEENILWRNVDKKFCDEMTKKIIDQLLEEMKGGGFAGSKRYKTLAVRLVRVVSRSLWLISEHIKRSEFEPIDFEVDFRDGGKYPPIEIELDSGQKVKLTGRIDRVDHLITDEGKYLRIIDYKSGSKDFQLADAYYGLQIQLLTYMDALWKDKSGYLPGGALYFRLDDPIISGSPLMYDDDIEKAIMKKLRMNGLVLADVKLIKHMDNTLDGTSLIIPIRLKKGDVISGSSAVTQEQFALLRNHTRKLLKETCEEIMKGNVSIKPYRKDRVSPCEYCQYTSVCQFDITMKDNTYKNLQSLDNDAVWRNIESKQKENEKVN